MRTVVTMAVIYIRVWVLRKRRRHISVLQRGSRNCHGRSTLTRRIERRRSVNREKRVYPSIDETTTTTGRTCPVSLVALTRFFTLRVSPSSRSFTPFHLLHFRRSPFSFLPTLRLENSSSPFYNFLPGSSRPRSYKSQ